MIDSKERSFLLQAREAVQKQDYSAAMQILNQTIRHYPDSIAAFAALVDILLLGWFPSNDQFAAAHRLCALFGKRFPDDPAVIERAERLRAKKIQTAAVEEGNRRIVDYQNRHRGERCVIIGNGPSLNKMDLSWLKNTCTFGLNRIYLAFERFGFIPTYLVSVNKFVLEQSAADLQAVPCQKFFSFEGVPQVQPAPDCVIINPRTWEDFFSTDPRQGICIGSTVTYVAMQLAFWMGFDEIVLIGLDHRFSTPGPAHALVESEGDDPNHFDPNYFGKGFKWQLPDLKNSEQMYRIADAYFRAYRKRIVDATVDGACPVFEKADYRDLFGL